MIAVLHAPNERHVYLAGNGFGERAYILAESWGDAWDEYLDFLARRGEVCDHGGEITDAERMAHYAGEPGGKACDCDLSDTGQWVWAVDEWMHELALPVDMFYLAGIEEEA